MLSLSIVSHQQFSLVQMLLEDLQRFCPQEIEVLLTLNIPETIPADFSAYAFPVSVIHNTSPKGFGTNHNAAFLKARYPFFGIINPDIRLTNNPFPNLIQDLSLEKTGVAVPAVMDEQGILQDNARKFLTLSNLYKRLCNIPDYSLNNIPSNPDWVAGMFMLFRKETYAEIGGFDEKYFMYCEDMDLCARLRKKNYIVHYNSAVKVIHTAQRNSRKHLRYFIWHLESLIRYFLKRYLFRTLSA